jgi:hypothetical protein
MSNYMLTEDLSKKLYVDRSTYGGQRWYDNSNSMK